MKLNDLTSVSVDLNLTFDTLDAILLVTTGGIGYLARQAYISISTNEARQIEIQQKNFETLINKALAIGAEKLLVRVHPSVSVYAPNGGHYAEVGRGDNCIDYEISLVRALTPPSGGRPPRSRAKRKPLGDAPKAGKPPRKT